MNIFKAPVSKPERVAFMSFVVEVDVSTPKWTKTVRNLISTMEGVSNCWINENGMVEVSGKVDPALLMKKLGKAGKNAHVHHLKFGKCSSNLFVPPSFRGDHHYQYFGGATSANNMCNMYHRSSGFAKQIHYPGPHYALPPPRGGGCHHHHRGMMAEQYAAPPRSSECDECEGVTIQCCTIM